MNLIGLGKLGCEVAAALKQYPQYKVYQIGIGIEGLKKDGYFNFPEFEEPEDYETKCPPVKNFLKKVSGDTVLIVSGAELISAASLKILEAIKTKAKVSVLYYKEDASPLDKTRKYMDRIAFSVFQEYARSGAINKAYLVSQKALSSLVGDVPVLEFRAKTISTLTSMFHMINVLQRDEPVYHNYSGPIEVARIATLGVASDEDGKENLLYPIELVREKTYLYLMPTQVLAEDKTLMKKIHETVKENSNHGKIKINFGVYESSYEVPLIYIVCSSSMVQGQDSVQ